MQALTHAQFSNTVQQIATNLKNGTYLHTQAHKQLATQYINTALKTHTSFYYNNITTVSCVILYASMLALKENNANIATQIIQAHYDESELTEHTVLTTKKQLFL